MATVEDEGLYRWALLVGMKCNDGAFAIVNGILCAFHGHISSVDFDNGKLRRWLL